MNDYTRDENLSPETEETASQIQHAFSDLQMRESVEQVKARSHLHSSNTNSRKALGSLVSVAAAITAVAVGLSLAGPGTAVAWANTPSELPAGFENLAAEKCGAVISRGLGDAQEIGTATVIGSEKPLAAEQETLNLPNRLPPLQVIDLRGDAAVAFYADEDWQVSCALLKVGSGWRDFGLSLTGASSDQTPGLISSGGTASVGGESINFISGSLPAGKTQVSFSLTTGEEVQASVFGSNFAAWYPGDVGVVQNSLKFE